MHIPFNSILTLTDINFTELSERSIKFSFPFFKKRKKRKIEHETEDE